MAAAEMCDLDSAATEVDGGRDHDLPRQARPAAVATPSRVASAAASDEPSRARTLSWPIVRDARERGQTEGMVMVPVGDDDRGERGDQ